MSLEVMASEPRVRVPSTSRERSLKSLKSLLGVAGFASISTLLLSGRGSAFASGRGRLPTAAQAAQQFAQADRGMPPLPTASPAFMRNMPGSSQAGSGESSASPTAWLALGAVAGLALQSLSRHESLITMFGKHDRRTFRGKIHAHTFGKYRMRKTKARRLRAIRQGKFDPDKVVQRGQPEPEHSWDAWNIMANKLYSHNRPQWFRDVWQRYYDGQVEAHREDWEKQMGKFGKQVWFKGWTPPGQEPPPPEIEPVEPKSPPPTPTPPTPEDQPPKPAEPAPEAKKEEPPAPEPEPKEEEPPAPEPEAKEEEPPAPEPEAKKEEPPAPEPVKEAKPEGSKISASAVKELRERSRAGILDCKKALNENAGDMDKAMDWLRKKGIAKADKKAGNIAVEGNIASYVHFNSKIAVLAEVNSETDFVASNAIFKEFATDIAMQIAANPAVTCVTADDVPEEVKAKEKELEMQKEDMAGKPDNIKEKIVEGRLKKKFSDMALLNQKFLKDEDKTVEEVLKERIAKLGENIVIRRFVRLNLGEGLEKKDDDFAAGVEKELAKYRSSPEEAATEKPKEEPKEEAKEEKPKEEQPKAEGPKISAAQVKELRGRSGAGILDSKKALKESGGDIDKAMEWLKKKGMAKADKKAGNLSVEGAIASYVHFNSKLGVIVEVNSETDFVAINAIFKEFASDVAMQIAANPLIASVSVDDVPAEIVEKEKEIEMNKEDLAGKPDNIKVKIVEGRLKKKYEEVSLMNQKWLKDEDKTVQEVLKEKIAKLGENIVIRRFERLVLGEGLEKKEDDFAAGVEKELAKYRS